RSGAHPDPGHRSAAGAGRQDHPPGPGPTAPAPGALEAGPLPGAGLRARRPEPALAADPARAPGARLHGRRHDPKKLPAAGAGPPSVAAPRVPTLRDRTGDRGPVGLEPLPRDDRRPGDRRPRLRDGPVLLAEILRGVLPRRAAADPALGPPGSLPLPPGP